MVPILLILAFAFVTQTVPKSAPPTTPDSVQVTERTVLLKAVQPLPEPTDSLDCDGAM